MLKNKSNLSELSPSNLSKEKDIDKNKQLNSPLNNSKTLKHSNSQAQYDPREGHKKFNYINQKIQIPNIYIERVEFVKEIFANEELGFVATYAPLAKTTTLNEMGKYFKIKLRNIMEIAAGILIYLSKNFNFRKNIFDNFNINNNNNNFNISIINNNNNSTISNNNNSSIINNTINNNSKKRTLIEILQSTEINSSEECCLLYRELCGLAGVKIEILSGLIKKKDYKIGDSLVKHKWCMLYCGVEKSYFIDPLLVIGEINSDGEFAKEIKPFYFLTPPLFFLENHLPDDDFYQFIPKPIKVKEFTKKILNLTENFYNPIFKYNIILKNRTSPEFLCEDSETIIKFIVENLEISIEFFLNGKKLNNNLVSITDNDIKNNYKITLKFPSNGDYKLNIYGKKSNSSDKLILLISYKIHVLIKNIINHNETKKKISPKKNILPKFLISSPQFHKNRLMKAKKVLNKCASDFGEKIKKKCYDNKNAHLFEPRCKILRIGQEAKFKVRVRNAKYVAVLDGRKWNYLRRMDDDIFEGIVPINNENIVVCAMRNNNLYTEVYEFLAIKR